MKFWSFLLNLINLFSCFTERLDNVFKDAGRPIFPNSIKALGPRSGLSTAVSDPAVRTREGLNSPFVSAGKVLLWLFSTVKSLSLKQRGLKLQVSQGWDQGQQQLQGGVAPPLCPWCHLWTLTVLLSRTVLAARGNHHVKTCYNVMPFSQEQRIRFGFLSSCHKRYF